MDSNAEQPDPRVSAVSLTYTSRQATTGYDRFPEIGTVAIEWNCDPGFPESAEASFAFAETGGSPKVQMAR
jgi:hypothetical protein